MSRVRGRAPLARCLVVWLLLTAAAGTVPLLTAAELSLAGELGGGTAAGVPFDRALAAVCAVALTGCAAWAWLVASLTVVQAVRGRSRRIAGCPEGVRRLVLAACGVAALTAAVAPAHADGGAGSPPSPPPAAAPPASAEPDDADRSRPRVGLADPTGAVEVAPGDSLWSIARESLPPAAGNAEIDVAWRALWAANRATIGDDPDVIHPGIALHLPTEKETR